MITVDFARLDIPEPPDSRPFTILDMGCGEGRHVCEAIRYPNVTAVGVDINIGDLKKAREKLTGHDDWGEGLGEWGVSAGDITRLPFGDGFFDAVICCEVLEHIPNHRAAVREIVRVLKPGGDLVVSAPRYGPEKLCWILSDEYSATPGGHIRIFSESGIRRFIEQFSVKHCSSHYAHGLHSPYWWLKCLLGLNRDDSRLINAYHRLLVWDMMDKPALTRLIERMLNPFIGKSVVLYFKKR